MTRRYGTVDTSNGAIRYGIPAVIYFTLGDRLAKPVPNVHYMYRRPQIERKKNFQTGTFEPISSSEHFYCGVSSRSWSPFNCDIKGSFLVKDNKKNV